MAFSVAIDNSTVKYPPTCPFCEVKNADEWITRTHNRPTGYYVIYWTYATYTIKLPICKECYSKARMLFWSGIGLIALPIILLSQWDVPIVLYAILGGIALLLYRWLWLGKIKPMRLHGGKGPFVLVVRSMAYARQLSIANGTNFEAYALFSLK